MICILSRAAAAALPIAIGTLTALPAVGVASTYDVWTCRAPDGSPAGTRDASGGWAPDAENVSRTGGHRAFDSCLAGGAITAVIGERQAQPTPSWVRWRFIAPAGTRLAKYLLDIEGSAQRADATTGSFGDVAVARDSQRDPDYDFRVHARGSFARQFVERDGGGDGSVIVHAGCGDAAAAGRECVAEPGGVAAAFTIYRGVFTLDDREAPSVTSVSGDAVTNETWAGPTGVSVAAGDVGGGVRRLGVEVDGQVQSWIPLAGGTCTAWPGTERTFLAPQPCPSSVAGLQAIQTSGLPEGVHTVRILVEDAAGNQTTAYGPTTKRLRRTDPGPNNGSPSSDTARLRAAWEGTESDVRTVRYDSRPVVVGQLATPTGQPIRDAYLRVLITRTARNSPPLERDPLKTDAQGRFRMRMPKGASSRSIVIEYHQRVRDDVPIAVRKLRLTVNAGVRLTLSRKAARRGQSVTLRGSLPGRPMPKLGKVVELQARNAGGKWITFKTVRAGATGRFTAKYRFRNPGPARFQMRARARRSGDYPYATGASPVRRIRVR